MNLRRKEALTNIAEGLFPYSETFLMWMICSGLMGLAGGAVGAVFYHMVSWANRVRAVHPELLWLLPVAGLVIVPAVSLFTRKPDQTLVDDAFACYEQKVLVPQREALGDRQ